MQADERIVIPVIEEFVEVGKRVVETGATVRVRRSATERVEHVHQTLLRDEYRVTRQPVERAVDSPPAPVINGDSVVVFVVEERSVVVRQLFVVEEVTMTREIREVSSQISLPVRRDDIVIERRARPGDDWTPL